jgi:carbon monoxide dehydrogenase subunit G
MPVDQFWDVVFDPNHLAQAIPGASSLEQVSPNRFAGTINRSLSGITIAMDVDIEVTDDDRPDSLDCRFHGEDAGTNSTLAGTVTLAASGTEENSTNIRYTIDWQLLGRLESIGSRMVKRQLQHDLSVFFSSFNDTQSNTHSATST